MVSPRLNLDKAFFWQQNQLSNSDLLLLLSQLSWPARHHKTSAPTHSPAKWISWSQAGLTIQLCPSQPAALVQVRGCARAGTLSRTRKVWLGLALTSGAARATCWAEMAFTDDYQWWTFGPEGHHRLALWGTWTSVDVANWELLWGGGHMARLKGQAVWAHLPKYSKAVV